MLMFVFGRQRWERPPCHAQDSEEMWRLHMSVFKSCARSLRDAVGARAGPARFIASITLQIMIYNGYKYFMIAAPGPEAVRGARAGRLYMCACPCFGRLCVFGSMVASKHSRMFCASGESGGGPARPGAAGGRRTPPGRRAERQPRGGRARRGATPGTRAGRGKEDTAISVIL